MFWMMLDLFVELIQNKEPKYNVFGIIFFFTRGKNVWNIRMYRKTACKGSSDKRKRQ